MKYFLSISLFILTGTISFAQNKPVTESVSVSGNCDMCKKRIENAAYIKGVKQASWSAETQKLTVTYQPGKVSLSKIEKSVAAVGHDTEHFKANQQAYDNIHSCCKYRDSDKP
jgi:copper chaperone CopZ